MAEQLTFAEIESFANADLVAKDGVILGSIKDELCGDREAEIAKIPTGILARMFKAYARETHFQRVRRIERGLICMASISDAAEELLAGSIDYPTYILSRELNLAMGGLEGRYTRQKQKMLKDALDDGD